MSRGFLPIRKTLQGGESHTVYLQGSNLYIKEITGKVLISIDNESEAEVFSGFLLKQTDGRQYRFVRFINGLAGVQATVWAILAGAEIDDKSAVFSGNINTADTTVHGLIEDTNTLLTTVNSNLDTVETKLDEVNNKLAANGTGIFDGDSISTSAVKIADANTSRKRIIISAAATNTGNVYVGFNNTVSSTKFIRVLDAFDSVSLEGYTGEIWAIGSAAGQVVCHGEW